MRLLAISGSLRAGSSNTALLQAARLVAPRDVEIALYEELAQLPAFDPGLDTIEGAQLPTIVRELRAEAASVTIALPSREMSAEAIAGNPALATSLRAALDAVRLAAAPGRGSPTHT